MAALIDLPGLNAIRVGKLYLKSRDVETHIAGCVRLLTFESNGIVSFSGSCTLVRLADRYTVIMTRHQLHIGRGVVISEENLSLIRVSASEDGQLKNIYTDKCLFDTSSTDEEFHDLIALRAVAGDQPNIRDAHKFFPLESFSNFTRRNSFVVGYPTFANAMDYDASHLKSQRAIIGCTIDPSFKSHASLFKKARLDTDKYALDGLSGGAVFSLVEVPSGYAMMMEGIILRGSGTEIYFVESAYLHTMLSSF